MSFAVESTSVWDRIQSPCATCGEAHNFELRKKRTSSGGPLIAFQCGNCGGRSSDWLPHEGLRIDDVDPWDENLAERYARRQREVAAEAQHEQRTERQAAYKLYLRSEHWKAVSARVLQRDGYLCRGCLTNRANQVHHLTYQDLQWDAGGIPVGGEFCWQLVSLCNECHERAHGAS